MASAQGRAGQSPSNLSMSWPAVDSSTKSTSTFYVFKSRQTMGAGVSAGQFPDSTREVVLPSPLLSGDSLEFFAVGIPRFSPSFSSQQHLSPSYFVGRVRIVSRRKSGRKVHLNGSWTDGFQTTRAMNLSSPSYPNLLNDALEPKGLADPLKSQSSSLLNANQP